MTADPNQSDEPVDPQAIEATAAVWMSLRDRGMSESETGEFVRWLQQDPRHAEVFAELDKTWKALDGLATMPSVHDATSNHAAHRPRVMPRRRSVLFGGALAAAAVLALAYLGVWRGFAPGHAAETAIGAFQKIDLPDGSVVQLNTDSAIEVRFTDTERRVHLVRGEVFFTVATNSARPFRVAASGVDVHAVGTAFNVRLRAATVDVLVTEGKVTVNHPTVLPTSGSSALVPAARAFSELSLTAGEWVKVPLVPTLATFQPAPVQILKMSPSDMSRALAWREQRLEFEAMALRDVVGEFNRYNRHRLIIADPALEQKRFSGTFRPDSYESFVRLLEENFGVTVQRSKNESVLRLGP